MLCVREGKQSFIHSLVWMCCMVCGCALLTSLIRSVVMGLLLWSIAPSATMMILSRFLSARFYKGKKSTRAHIRTYIHTGENGEEILTSFTALELMGFPCLSVAPSATMIILRREPRKRLCRTNTGGLKHAVCVCVCIGMYA